MASMNSVDMILADHLLGSIHLGLRSPMLIIQSILPASVP